MICLPALDAGGCELEVQELQRQHQSMAVSTDILHVHQAHAKVPALLIC